MKTLPKFETEYDGSLVVNGVVVAHPTPEFTREHIALAAAAPDLLAALQDISANAAEDYRWIRRKADEAIAKATGESQL